MIDFSKCQSFITVQCYVSNVTEQDKYLSNRWNFCKLNKIALYCLSIFININLNKPYCYCRLWLITSMTDFSRVTRIWYSTPQSLSVLSHVRHCVKLHCYFNRCQHPKVRHVSDRQRVICVLGFAEREQSGWTDCAGSCGGEHLQCLLCYYV